MRLYRSGIKAYVVNDSTGCGGPTPQKWPTGGTTALCETWSSPSRRRRELRRGSLPFLGWFLPLRGDVLLPPSRSAPLPSCSWGNAPCRGSPCRLGGPSSRWRWWCTGSCAPPGIWRRTGSPPPSARANWRPRPTGNAVVMALGRPLNLSTAATSRFSARWPLSAVITRDFGRGYCGGGCCCDVRGSAAPRVSARRPALQAVQRRTPGPDGPGVQAVSDQMNLRDEIPSLPCT